MSRTFSRTFAAALGLTALALAATTFAQQFSNDRRPGSAPNPPQAFAEAVDTFRGDVAVSVPGRSSDTREESRLSTEVDQLAHQLGQAKTDDETVKLKDKIADVLNKQFDQRQRRHESEIEALEAQVKKLKGLVQLRNEKRQEIVAKRLEQIVRDAAGLGW